MKTWLVHSNKKGEFGGLLVVRSRKGDWSFFNCMVMNYGSGAPPFVRSRSSLPDPNPLGFQDVVLSSALEDAFNSEKVVATLEKLTRPLRSYNGVLELGLTYAESVVDSAMRNEPDSESDER